MTHSVYLLLLGFLLAHELDAVACREWRLLYVLRRLPEAVAQPIFIALHVPLITGLVWTASASQPGGEYARIAVAVFAVIHAALHFRLRHAPQYGFHSPLSVALIGGSAGCGAVYVMATLGQ